jgi:protein SCO1/2
MSDQRPDSAPPPSGRSGPGFLGLTRRVAWIAVLLIAVPGLLLYAGKQLGWFGAPAPVARPAVGGPFELVTHEGRAATDADYRGRLMIVYFGFTYCPDVCPTGLTAIARALDLLGAGAVNVVPLFVTVDPERDTPEQLKEYVRHFHPRLIGLTGTAEQIAKAAKAYRVYYAKARPQGAPADEYTMDHTAIIYLMGRDGKFISHFSHGTEPEAIAARIRANL